MVKDMEKIVGTRRRQLRHCMVVHAYYPLGEIRVEREALVLKDHGLHVDVNCLKGPRRPAIGLVDGIPVYRLPVRRRRGSGFIIQLLEYLTFLVLSSFHLSRLHLQNRYDVVQVHNLPDFLVFVALIPKLTGAKIVLDLHDLMPESFFRTLPMVDEEPTCALPSLSGGSCGCLC